MRDLGKQELKFPEKKTAKKKRAVRTVQTKKDKSKNAFLILIPALLVNVGIHFYLSPNSFLERIITAIMLLSIMLAGLYVGYITYFNMRKKNNG